MTTIEDIEVVSISQRRNLPASAAEVTTITYRNPNDPSSELQIQIPMLRYVSPGQRINVTLEVVDDPIGQDV